MAQDLNIVGVNLFNFSLTFDATGLKNEDLMMRKRRRRRRRRRRRP